MHRSTSFGRSRVQITTVQLGAKARELGVVKKFPPFPSQISEVSGFWPPTKYRIATGPAVQRDYPMPRPREGSPRHQALRSLQALPWVTLLVRQQHDPARVIRFMPPVTPPGSNRFVRLRLSRRVTRNLPDPVGQRTGMRPRGAGRTPSKKSDWDWSCPQPAVRPVKRR